jgi:hypothetical protein
MYFDDHGPPHFHAYYGDQMAIMGIETLRVLRGSLPWRALAMVLEWAFAHREELMENWDLAESHQPLKQIRPLE